MSALEVVAETPEICRVPGYGLWTLAFSSVADFVVVDEFREGVCLLLGIYIGCHAGSWPPLLYLVGSDPALEESGC